MSAIDEPGVDGLTIPEALSSRVLMIVGDVIKDRQAGLISDVEVCARVDLLVDATIAFLTPVVKEALYQVQRTLKQLADQAKSAELQAAMEMGIAQDQEGIFA